MIGVGDYPHLNGGIGPPAADPLGLSQITTPRFTAPAIAKWLLGEYQNPACPLGSVEVLLSPAAQIALPGGGQANTQRATMGNVKQSFAAWQARCSKQADNIAFFYFCGHGLHKGEQFLLPEDFANPALPKRWENCIDFDGMRIGMRKCAAQTQLFLVDACRETPFGMLTQLAIQGDPLIDGADISDTVRCSAAYYATAQGQQAYGPADGITYFGQAALSCLNGVASLNKLGKWVVDSYSLGNALGQVMAQMARRHRLALTCNPDVTGMARIHVAKAPRVVVSVECTSDAANVVADIVLRSGAVQFHSGLGQPKPMVEEVDAGNWDVEVRFPGGQFPAPPPFSYSLMPPVFEGVPVP
ncbi:MAG: caspase family protein [Candidatus Methylophosphatis roskildensis]